MISKITGRHCCCRNRFGDFSFGERVISKKKRSSPPRWCHFHLTEEESSVVTSVEPVFRLFQLQKYASDGIDLHTTPPLSDAFTQRWALPQIGPQIRKLRTQVSICGFANLISYRKYLWICGEKLKFTANPQTNRQCCLIRGKTARKKWMLLFSGLEVDDRELMTFFFFFGGQRLVDGKI